MRRVNVSPTVPDSPYILTGRLADVIAAIQTMGTYKFYKLSFQKWADRITGDETTAAHWKSVFEEHPEFFRLDSGREHASLVWRRQHQKLFNVDAGAQIARADYLRLSDEQKLRISRTPLSATEITALIETAIRLHTQALEMRKEDRWWIDPILGLAGAVISLLGVVIGAVISTALS